MSFLDFFRNLGTSSPVTTVNNGYNSQNVPILGDPDFQDMYSRLFGTSTTTSRSVPTGTIPPGTMTLWDRIAQSGAAGTAMVGMSNIPATTTATGGPLPTKTLVKTSVPTAQTAPVASKTAQVKTPTGQNSAIKAGGQTQAAAMGVNLSGAKTPEELNPQNQIAADAARAGMSVPEYMALNTLSKEESDLLAKELGVTDTENALFKRPSETTEELYTRLYDTTGLADIKMQINTLMKEINADRQKTLEALAEVNENPWLSEKSRVGRGKRILEQLEARIGNKINEVDRLNALYTMGMSEIDRVIQRRTADFTQNQTVNTAKLNYLNAKMEKRVQQILAKRAMEGLGTFAKEKQKQAEKNKQIEAGDKLITVGDSVFYWDPVTKKLVEVGQGKKTLSMSDTPSSYKEWVLAGKPGTYADWVKKGAERTPTSEEVKQFIRKQMATPEFKALTPEEKKDYILSVGGDPMDYGIY